MGKSREEQTAPLRESRLQKPGWEGGREGRRRPRGAGCERTGVGGCSFVAAMKRPCEETTSESDMDETIDVGSENNYSG